MVTALNKKDEKLELLYTLFCDDVRLEAGNKLSFMGVFQNIMVNQVPISLIKFAVVNHWRGEGTHLSEVRILTPDRQHPIVVSQPTSFEIQPSQWGIAQYKALLGAIRLKDVVRIEVTVGPRPDSVPENPPH